MPYTKRMPHYNSPNELISYILDEKNDFSIFASGDGT